MTVGVQDDIDTKFSSFIWRKEMKFEIIFYRSGKTAAMQQEAEKLFEPYGINISGASAASDPTELAQKLSVSLKRRKLIVIIGGVDGTSQSTEKIISEILQPKNNKKGADIRCISKKDCKAYYLISGSQMIMIMPDEAGIADNIGSDTGTLMKKHFGLEGEQVITHDISQVNKEISSDISITKRTPVVPSGSTAEGRNREKLNLLKILMIIMLAIGAAGLIAGTIMLFMMYNT